MYEVIDTKRGKCPLCNSKKTTEKSLFIVKGPYNGEICPEHLMLLAQQQKNGDQQ
jgi:RNA polymerase subunit RPABC4/transcription elongation factor Spt4